MSETDVSFRRAQNGPAEPRRTALALSPHLDDAVFSCGGTLATMARDGWRVVVATLFTQSVPDPTGFALSCQLDKGLGPEVDYMALRRAEDRVAMRALGVSAPIHVPLPEAPHRGYDSAKALFGPPRPDDGIVALLRAVVDSLIADHAPDLLLAPQAIGGHIDHVQLVRALPTKGIPTRWWRDFPYTVRSGLPAEPFRSNMAALPERETVLDAPACAAREAACLAYATQLDFQFGGAEQLKQALAAAGNSELFRGSA